MDTLFFNFCLHELQKLNYYNHASTWIKPKICDNLKNKIQVFENEMFLQVFFFFFHAPWYWYGEHPNIILLVKSFCFQN